jgi:hypothetical protein
MSDQQQPGGLVNPVQDFANEVFRLCEQASRVDLAERLRVEAGRYRQPATTVVVIGEEKRGKSSLINALLGEPAVLPVEADVATNCHIAVQRGRTLEATVLLAGETEPRAIEPRQLADYATVTGNPGNRRGVQGVIVRHPSPLLRGKLTLVDTPGVGGLEGSHAELTLATLPVADALLMVLDAGSPMSSSELAFLQEASERVSSVVFAVTMTDRFRGWRTIVDDNRSLLREHAPRFADATIIGVSSRLAQAANEQVDRPDRADKLLAESHIEELRATLRQLVDTSQGVRLANLVQFGRKVIDEIGALDRDRLTSAYDDPGWGQRLEDERAQLDRVAEASSRWRLDLDLEMRRMALDFDTRVDMTFPKVERRLLEQVKDGSASLDTTVDEVDTALSALWIELGSFAGERIQAILAKLVDDLEIEGVHLGVDGLVMPEHLLETLAMRQENADSDDRIDWSEQFLQSYPALFAGWLPVGIANTLAGVGLTFLGGPVAWVIGATFAGTVYGARRHQLKRTKEQRKATEFLKLALADARRAATKQFTQHTAETRRVLEETVGRQLAERKRAVELLLREHQELARQDQQERERLKADVEERLSRVEALTRRSDELLVGLAAERPAEAVPSAPSSNDDPMDG